MYKRTLNGAYGQLHYCISILVVKVNLEWTLVHLTFNLILLLNAKVHLQNYGKVLVVFEKERFDLHFEMTLNSFRCRKAYLFGFPVLAVPLLVQNCLQIFSFSGLTVNNSMANNNLKFLKSSNEIHAESNKKYFHRNRKPSYPWKGDPLCEHFVVQVSYKIVYAFWMSLIHLMY